MYLLADMQTATARTYEWYSTLNFLDIAQGDKVAIKWIGDHLGAD
jgi:hypothetical protein